MALRMLEGFDYFTTDADGALRFNFYDTGFAVTAAAGRNGTASCRANNYDNILSAVFDSRDTWFVGFAWKAAALHPAANGGTLLRFTDTTIQHVTLAVLPDGSVRALRGSQAGTVLGTTATGVLSAGAYYYIEAKVVISDTVGEVVLHVNGVNVPFTWVTGTSTTQDTRNAGNASANIITWLGNSGSSSSTTIDLDDLYVCDSSGSSNNTFLGDIRVEALLPSGAGNSAQFTPSASTNASNVDDTAEDGDTTYNESSTVNHLDSFAMGNSAIAAGSAVGVEIINYVRKTDAGSSTVAPVIRHSGTNYVGTDQAPGTTYRYLSQVYDVNPGTSAAFTIADINAMEVGYKKTG